MLGLGLKLNGGGAPRPREGNFQVTRSSFNPVAGTAVTITAQLRDAHNNPLHSAGHIITWSKTGAGGSFSSPTSTTDSLGVATVSFTTSNTSGVAYTVTATDQHGTTGVSGAITSVPGTAFAYAVTSSTYAPTAGGTATISAQLQDNHGNNVLSSGHVVTWSKTGSGGSFSAGTSNTNGSGIATITFTAGTTAGTAYVITGTDAGALTGSTSTLTSVAGAASKYIVTSSTYAPTAAGTATITAQLTDANNNVVSTAGNVVTWSKTGSGGSFANPTSATDGSGIATIVFTAGVTAGTAYVITGTDAGALTGSTSTLTSVAGAASKYVVTSSDYAPTAGGNVTISAQLTDANNNSVNTASLVVTWSKSGSGGSFANPTSTTNGSGIATIVFTTGNAGTTYAVTGTDTNAATGTSPSIVTAVSAAVTNWVSRIVSNGGSTPSGATLTAVDTYYRGCVTDGLDTLILADILLVPDSLIAATTPFFHAKGAAQWTDATGNAFNSGNLTTNGLATGGTGSPKGLHTGFNPSSDFASANSCTFGFYCTSSFLNMRMNAYNGTNMAGLYTDGGGNCYLGAYNAWDLSPNVSNVKCYIAATRTASNAVAMYRYNSSIGFTTAATGSAGPGTRPNLEMYAFGWNSNGSFSQPIDGSASYIFIALGMTSTQVNNHALRVQQLRVDLGGGSI